MALPLDRAEYGFTQLIGTLKSMQKNTNIYNANATNRIRTG